MKSSIQKSLAGILFIATFMFMINQKTYAHCEIPCGIYEDSLRIALIKEHITTIEKSMNKINELSAEGTPNYNQLIRWTFNKEEHAKKIQDIVSQYFLHQRLKITDPADKEAYSKYLKELELLHQLLVYAMKGKQTTDLAYIEKMREAIDDFSESYFHTHSH